jgi:hypothetical protein
MPNFTAGTSFGANDTVTNTKLNALIADAVINPECALSINSGTIGTLSCTRGTIGTFNSTTGTVATLNSTAATIQTLTASTLSGTLTGGTYTGSFAGSFGTSCNFTAGTINNFTSSSNATIAGRTIGTGAGQANVAFGLNTLGSNTTGGLNAGVGNSALQANTSGSFNSAFGEQSLLVNNTGSFNSSFGVATLDSNTSGSNNSAFGYAALGDNTTGILNTAIGYFAGNNTTGSNNTFIGNGAVNTTGGATASNTIVLGNSAIATLRCQTQTITSLSDARDKSNIEEIPVGIDFIKDLRPVKFTWNQRDGMRVGLTDAGFVAQESLDVVNRHHADWIGLVDNQNPDQIGMSYGKLIPVLVKAIQQLSAKVDSLEAQLASK